MFFSFSENNWFLSHASQAQLVFIYLSELEFFMRGCTFKASKVFSGKDVVAVDSPFGCLGLTVCYDLRFPELYHQLRFKHQAQVWVCFLLSKCSLVLHHTGQYWYLGMYMQVLLVPSAFTKVTGEAHWEILLRARAIETQSYVCRLFNLFALFRRNAFNLSIRFYRDSAPFQSDFCPVS